MLAFNRLQEEFESLQHLNLDNNLVSDVFGVAQLSRLEVLTINSNRIADQCSFKLKTSMGALTEVRQHSNQENRGAKNASLLSSGKATPASCNTVSDEVFPCLQVLQLGDNQISSIAGLELNNLILLQSLFLHHNEITRVDGLNSLVNLKELVLDGNRIKYIDPGSFVGLTRLQELRMEENGLRSLANLHPLVALNSLQLGMNRITDVASLDKLSSLTNLVEISLCNNPVCRKQVYRAVVLAKCPSLMNVDNGPVALEEREYVNSLFATNHASSAFSMDSGPAVPRRYGIPDLQANQGSKVPIRMTALNFESFLMQGIPGQQQSPFGTNSPGATFAPSIPGINAVTPRFGLEGVALRENQPQGQGVRMLLKADLRENGNRAAKQENKVPSSTEKRGRSIHRMYY